jgi:hypothetical protein
MSEQNFPTSISGFFSYLVAVMLWLETHKTRLGITDEAFDALKNKYGDIVTVGTYLYWKNQWDIAPARKDTKITTNLATLTAEIKVMLMNIYNDIPASKWTDNDRITLRRKTGLQHTPTHPVNPIKETCTVAVEARPNALFNFTVITNDDNKSAAIPDDADAVEVSYVVVESKYRKIDEATTGKVQKECLGPEDGTKKLISSKAKFQLQAPIELIGFDMVYYVRYINISYPALAGEWTEPGTILIS